MAMKFADPEEEKYNIFKDIPIICNLLSGYYITSGV
jgi:hypothetical protein